MVNYQVLPGFHSSNTVKVCRLVNICQNFLNERHTRVLVGLLVTWYSSMAIIVLQNVPSAHLPGTRFPTGTGDRIKDDGTISTLKSATKTHVRPRNNATATS